MPMIQVNPGRYRRVSLEEYRLALPCIHRGEAAGDTHACRLHGRCTDTPRSHVRRACATCEDHTLIEWVSVDRMAGDAVLLAARCPPDTRGIMGIPRSGMIAASVMSTILHVPLYELTADGGRLLGHGRNIVPRWTGPLVCVDDTVYGGGTIARARQWLRHLHVLYAAVYVTPTHTAHVDLFQRVLGLPHALEWNLFNNGLLQGCALDFDGVVCHDESSGGTIGAPYLLPRLLPIPLIATGRLEHYRSDTEGWMRAHGVQWDRLEMYPASRPYNLEGIAHFKADCLLRSGLDFFIESCPTQAAIIADITAHAVMCPRAKKVF